MLFLQSGETAIGLYMLTCVYDAIGVKRAYDVMERLRSSARTYIALAALAAAGCGGDKDNITGDVTDDGNGNGGNNHVTLPGKNYNVAGTTASYEKSGNDIVFRFIHPTTKQIVEARVAELPFENAAGYRNPADFDDNGQVSQTDIPKAGSIDDLVSLQTNWGNVEQKAPNGEIQNGYRNVGDVYVEVPQKILDNADRYKIRVGTKDFSVAKVDLVDKKFAYVPTGAQDGSLEVVVWADDKNGQRMTYVSEIAQADLPKVYASGEVVDKKIMDINIPKNGDRVYLMVETEDNPDVVGIAYNTFVNGREVGRGGCRFTF